MIKYSSSRVFKLINLNSSFSPETTVKDHERVYMYRINKLSLYEFSDI